MSDHTTGQTVGQYRLVRELGEGGMGVVYEAVHQEIGKRAAIKMLHPEYARKPEFTSRFFNEACANTVVHHPGIVDIYEYGHTSDGRPYIVMEFLEGEVLRARMERIGGGLGRIALRVTRQVASALAAAHDKGIVHRDLKPENVMLVPDPESVGGERVKILDFGIAKLAADYSGPRSSSQRTGTGASMGTAVYMAPEQCRSSAGVDARADVYSLGVMLYEMLAGRPPFIGEGTGHVMGMHMYEAPPPLGEFVHGLDPGLVALVHGMLAKDPKMRPGMRELIQALEDLGAPSPSGALVLTPRAGPRAAGLTTQQRSTLGHSVGEASRRAAPRRAGVVAAAAAGLVGLGVVLLASRPDPPPPKPVTAPEPDLAPARPDVPRTIHWSVRTTPAGAEVLRAADGVVIGRTPLELDRPAGEGRIRAVLHLLGYHPREIDLPLDGEARLTERLEPLSRTLPQATPGEPGSRRRTPGASPKGRTPDETTEKAVAPAEPAIKRPTDWGEN